MYKPNNRGGSSGQPSSGGSSRPSSGGQRSSYRGSSPTGRSTGGSDSSRPSGGYSRSTSGGSSRPSGGYSRSSGGSSRPSGGYSRSSGGGNRGRSSRPRYGGDSNISHSRFICKADPIVQSAPYIPVNKFADFNIHPTIKSNITKKGYVNPTPIQDVSIPFVLDGRDVVGIANTGTGKTAAFLIPLLDKIMNNPREKVLVIVPTRELATQINEELIAFRGALRIYSVCCVGGMGISNQIYGLRRDHNIVIGTPGRLKDLVDRRVIHLADFRTIVLDEADRMLDMGFVNDMRFIMANMAPNRQTLLFSATITSEIDKLINEFLTNPEKISTKTGDTARNVDQDIIRVPQGMDKIDSLHSLLSKKEFSKVLIFGRTKHGVEKLCQTLVQRGYKAESIHGDKNQSRRERALKSFRDNYSQILVATDVAARGLDIPDVTHVINYEIPATYEDYVHRIGRTGRGNKVGTALTYVN